MARPDHRLFLVFAFVLLDTDVPLTFHVKLEKAEILEKTITYIKKLQEITGKQEPKTGRKSSDPHLEGMFNRHNLEMCSGGGYSSYQHLGYTCISCQTSKIANT